MRTIFLIVNVGRYIVKDITMTRVGEVRPGLLVGVASELV